MNYYLVSPIGVKSPLLTYESEQACEKGEVCAIELRGKHIAGVVAGVCEKPAFACKRAKILKNYLLPHQAHLARFIAQYYCVELGEAYSVFVPAEGDLAGDEGVESARVDSVEAGDSDKGYFEKGGDCAGGVESAGGARGASGGRSGAKDSCATNLRVSHACSAESRMIESRALKSCETQSHATKSHCKDSHASKPKSSRPTKSRGTKSRSIESKKLYTAPIAPPKALSPAQQDALEFLSSHTNALLFGDTGSGKTEIYIHLIINALNEGKSALFLMPEIALTPQIESRLKAVFGEAVAIWHSKITPARKRKILEGLKQGSVRVVAGARSALFLPLCELGLIIVDEEHDDAYKSQSTPRYNARDLALYLGSEGLARVVLGSATPSVVSYYHAKRRGVVWRLRGRYFESKKNLSIVEHSALRLKSAIDKARGVDEPCVLSPCSPCQSPDLSSQILECQESATGHSALRSPNSSLGNHSRNAKALIHCSARQSAPHSQSEAIAQSNTANTRIVCGEIQDSKADSESTASDSHSVIASAAKQSIKQDSKSVDCHADKSARNDEKTESAPRASLESTADSENPSGGVYLHRDKHKIARSADLEASSGWGIVKGEGATSQFKPLPLNKKENIESNEVLEFKEVKAKDSEKLDSETENKAESARVGDSKKWDLKSKKSESITDSELQKGKSGDSKGVDCHADKSARNDDRLDSQSIACCNFAPAKSHNDKGRDSKSEYNHEATPAHNDKSLESQADSKKRDCHADKPARNDNTRASIESYNDNTHATAESRHTLESPFARNDRALESTLPNALDSNHLHAPPHIDDENDNTIAPPILSAIARKLEKKEQVIIFLPTRAHYKMLLCRECGGGVECEFCSVNMSLHLDKNALVCHYCHACKPVPHACPQCGAHSLRSHRIGTASVAEWLSQRLPYARIALFDRDAITTHKKLTTTLKAFNDGEIDILVGTQMLSKGHDYHNVNLAVILGIDYILKGSDYRANERAVSLLHQIAGRAGRRYDGEVCIESSHGAFLEAFLGDYEAFLEYELGARPRLYPPFVRLASITIAHKSEAKALEALQALRENLLAMEKGAVEVVGDSKALLERLHGKFRYIMLLRSSSTRALLEVIHRIRASAGEFLRLYEIDVDPLSII